MCIRDRLRAPVAGIRCGGVRAQRGAQTARPERRELARRHRDGRGSDCICVRVSSPLTRARAVGRGTLRRARAHELLCSSGTHRAGGRCRCVERSLVPDSGAASGGVRVRVQPRAFQGELSGLAFAASNHIVTPRVEPTRATDARDPAPDGGSAAARYQSCPRALDDFRSGVSTATALIARHFISSSPYNALRSSLRATSATGSITYTASRRSAKGSTCALLPFGYSENAASVSYTHLRAHETPEHLVCRLLL